MKTEHILFTCDCCGKRQEEPSTKGFPYYLSWVYAYNLEIKISDKVRPPIRDKHFCSMDCLTKWIKINLGEKSEMSAVQ